MLSNLVVSIKSVEFIYCGCGCGFTRSKYLFENGRPRKDRPIEFIFGHQNLGRFSGENNPNYHGGHINNGYKMIMKKDHPFADYCGYVMEHRLVWEEYHKAILLPWGIVHHKNEIKTDNRIKNLEGMTKGQHNKVHLRHKKKSV